MRLISLSRFSLFAFVILTSDRCWCAATRASVRPWRCGVIPYNLTNVTSDDHRQAIVSIFRQLETVGGIHFVEYTSQPRYISLFTFLVTPSPDNPTSEDYSAIGEPSSVGILRVVPTDTVGLLHELGHVFGLIHEQQRNDRDSFLMVGQLKTVDSTGRICSGQYEKYPDTVAVGMPINPDGTHFYDFDSIMQYPPRDDCRAGEYAMTPIRNGDGSALRPGQLESIRDTRMGKASGYDSYDLRAIQSLYPFTTITLITDSSAGSMGEVSIDPHVVFPCDPTAVVIDTSTVNCGLNCKSKKMSQGAVLRVSARAEAGFTFDGWTGDVDATQQTQVSIDVSMTRDVNITAHFRPDDSSKPPTGPRTCWTWNRSIGTAGGWVWNTLCGQLPPHGPNDQPNDGRCWHWTETSGQGAWLLDGDCGGSCTQTSATSVRAVSSERARITMPPNLSLSGVPIVFCNPHSVGVEIITSRDPNEKVGGQGVGPSHYLAAAEPLRYSIYFENTPTATAAPQDVVVRDGLDRTKVDLSTATLGPIAIVDKVVTPPPIPLAAIGTFVTYVDLRPRVNLIARVDVSLDNSSGALSWRFQSIDPETNQPTTDHGRDTGLLPIGGEGSVSFTVRPRSTLTTNDAVPNSATVVFDGIPLDTPVWSNAIDANNPVSHIIPLAATEAQASFPVAWTGTDVGAGIQDYTLYVSDNGGAFTTWRANVTETTATFTGQAGHMYRFYSIARDLVGNVEPAKSAAEATTTVIATLLGDVNGDGVVDCKDLTIVTAALGTKPGQPKWDERADVVKDGVIDVRDVAFVSQRLPVGTRCQ